MVSREAGLRMGARNAELNSITYILRAVDCYIFYILPFVRVHNTLRSCQSFCAGGNVTVTGSSPNI